MMFKGFFEIFEGKRPTIRIMLRRYGVLKVIFGITILSIITSTLITIGIMLLTDGVISGTGLLISILIPALLAPLFEYRALSTLLQLDLAEEKLKITSTTDELTQAYNRRHFFEVASQELARAQRYGGKFSVAIMDIDHFKSINDMHGHLAGDQILRELSNICAKNIRLPDIFGRYGGDEFIFLFPETGREKAKECMERIDASISASPIQYENLEIKTRISIGLAEFSNEIHSIIDEVLKEADQALYRAKREGGNKVL
ncbi:MAG: GGDEF domain-containing protein [Anaerolineales bacterium]|nr:GGDEF domain-containing protein [Anaerolineales bacterium]